MKLGSGRNQTAHVLADTGVTGVPTMKQNLKKSVLRRSREYKIPDPDLINDILADLFDGNSFELE